MGEKVSKIEVTIEVEDLGNARADLIRFYAPKTVEAILKKLPISGRAAHLKEKIYFETSIKMGGEKSTIKVEGGDLAFWPLKSAFCIFYGQSQPYSAVNIIGKVTANIALFNKVKDGDRILVTNI